MDKKASMKEANSTTAVDTVSEATVCRDRNDACSFSSGNDATADDVPENLTSGKTGLNANILAEGESVLSTDNAANSNSNIDSNVENVACGKIGLNFENLACKWTELKKQDDGEVQKDSAASPTDVVTFRDQEHGSLCDITLDTGDKQFRCRRGVLCKHSEYFQAMFCSGMLESSASVVSLVSVDSQHFEALLNYLYTDHLTITLSNVADMVEVSTKYQVKRVLDQCVDFMLQTISSDSCLHLMQLANLYMLSDVYHYSRVHALWHFTEVVKKKSFLDIPHSLLMNYLQDPYLNCDSELWVFQAAADWLVHQDCPSDVSMLDFFASVVHFDGCSDEDFVCWEHLLDDFLKNHDVLNTFVSSLSEASVLAILREKSKGRCRIHPTEGAILVIGAHRCSDGGGKEVKNDSRSPINYIRQFNPESCTLEKFCSLPQDQPVCIGFGVCVVGSMLYMCGGEESLGRVGKWRKAIWRLNLLDVLAPQWAEVGTLPQERRHHGMCAINDRFILLIGGFGRYRLRLRSVECFDTHKNSFIPGKVPDMPHEDTSPAVTVHRDKVYVFKCFLQVLDTSSWQWSVLKLREPILCHHVFAGSRSNSIYVSSMSSNSLWRVDLDSLEVQALAHFRHNLGGEVVFRNKLFNFGEEIMGWKVTVETCDMTTLAVSDVGQLDGVTGLSQFITVPQFPKFRPSSDVLF